MSSKSVPIVLSMLTTAFAVAQPIESLPTEGLPEILRLAVSKSNSLRYNGTRIVQIKSGGKPQTITEYITRDGERLRIDFPKDSAFAGQIIIEDARLRRHFFPEQNELLTLPPRRGDSLARLVVGLNRFRNRRKVKVEAGSVVAGRMTREVVVSDDQGNDLQRLYIDPTTGAVLKSEVYDFAGTPMGSYEFKTIEFVNRVNPRLFDFRRKGVRIVSPEDQARELAKKLDLPVVLLPKNSGYQLESARIIQPEGSDVLVYLYSSPLGRLSVFQTRKEVDERKIRRMDRGELSVKTWRVGPVHYAVIGPKGNETNQVASRIERQSRSN